MTNKIICLLELISRRIFITIRIYKNFSDAQILNSGINTKKQKIYSREFIVLFRAYYQQFYTASVTESEKLPFWLRHIKESDKTAS